MKFTAIIDSSEDIDAVGEYLRREFFAKEKDPKGWNVGCYSTFDWAEGVKELESLPVCTEEDWNEEGGLTWSAVFDDMKWTRGTKTLSDAGGGEGQVECRWYWDGDGTLLFILPDGSCIVNSDCKKDHDWREYASFEVYDKGDMV